MEVLVTGATGFVGRRLVPALVAAGHDVRAMTRNPDRYDGKGTAVGGDVHKPATLAEALEGAGTAYYLVHSLGEKDFERLDAGAAKAFGEAAADAGVEQIIYLGGLGRDEDDLSAHLRSRREVEGLLGQGGVPVTTLRAGIVVGDGGISWEITRQLVEHLPAIVTPRWVGTRTQPIVPVPLLSPRLSSLWLALVTDVDTATGRSLVDSMTNEVVVTDPRIRELVPFEPLGYDEAVKVALADRRGRLG